MDRSLSTGAKVALGIAALSALLVVGAFTVPVYTGVTYSASSSPDGTTVTTPAVNTSATLFEQNGWDSLVIAVPLLLTVATGTLLALRARRRWAGRAAWVPVGLCAALAVLGMLTIGVFIVPVVVALAVAVSVQPGGPAVMAPQTTGHDW